MTIEPEAVSAPAPDEWAIVEIMGHLRRAGRICEVARFGANLLRVDIPIPGEAEGETIFVSEFFSGASIYRLRPYSEEIAREAARQIGDPRPVMPVAYRLAGPAPYDVDDDDLDDDDDGRPF
jgi:hypothetical protein